MSHTCCGGWHGASSSSCGDLGDRHHSGVGQAAREERGRPLSMLVAWFVVVPTAGNWADPFAWVILWGRTTAPDKQKDRSPKGQGCRCRLCPSGLDNSGYRSPAGETLPGPEAGPGLAYPGTHPLPPDAGPARGSPGGGVGRSRGRQGREPGQLQPRPAGCRQPPEGETFCRAGSGPGPRERPPAPRGAGKGQRRCHRPGSTTEPDGSRDGSGLSRVWEQSPGTARERWGEPAVLPGCRILCKLRQTGLQPSSPTAERRGAGGRRGERRLTKRGTLRGGRKPAGA